ncbi:hypothetical protein H2200_008953 [Cladophialophora chaetospira]|uniref:3-hydroxyisobutyrate dehydrogenase protein n=1 Tax=Cladophialophora chaetospira TaxID=386627 RepID=A0AA38X4Z4_9EURO|nr:hypothetical protein H2200_008953 [Cladophialophora chaetospira]
MAQPQPRRHGGARLPANAVATTYSPPLQSQSPYNASPITAPSPASHGSASSGAGRHGGARLPSGASSTIPDGNVQVSPPSTAVATLAESIEVTPNGRAVPARETSPSISQASTWQQQSPGSYEKRPVNPFEDAITPSSSNEPTFYSGAYGPNNSYTPAAMIPPPPVPDEKTMAYTKSHKGSMSGLSVHTVDAVPTYRAKDGAVVVSESQIQLRERPELQNPSYHAPVQTRRRMHQKGYRNFWSTRTVYRFRKAVHLHQRPGHAYASGATHRHRDAVNRVVNKIEEDRFIQIDRHIERMMVQCTDEIYEGPRNSTWRRTFVRNMAPWAIRIANWPLNTTPIDAKHWSNEDWMWIIVKWPVSCVLLVFTLLKVGSLYGGTSYLARYEQFPYKFWGYPKFARNQLENAPGKHVAAVDGQGAHPVSERPLYPRRLCFVDSASKDGGGIHLYDVELWLQQHNMIEHDMRFIVVAYTSTQFTDTDEDTEALHAIAREAAIQNKCPAYWVGSACMSEDQLELEQDVFRISDVIRAAYAVVIAIKPQPGNQTASVDGLLKDWGSRMWTLPEALLAPKDKPIQIYNARGGRPEFVKELPKKDLATLVWSDTSLTRQLVDHYEGNLTLSRLELVILALKCLSQRRTSKYLNGDLAYVLMGLLRRRPVIDHTDSEFQAFARLSLANDSDNLLERLICILPKTDTQPWYHANDMYNVNLWDIQPTVQIAGVCEDDTVILDGVLGASIRWETFVAVAHDTAWSFKRLIAKAWLRISGLVLIVLVCFGSALHLSTGTVILILCLILPAIVLSPWLVRVLYGGKVWNVAPHLLGFEGYLDIVTIETNIYGHYTGRLAWSAAGSHLSRHQMNQYGECIGEDPTGDSMIADMVKQAKYSKFGEPKVFTLVDTWNGVVTLFTAVRPPVAALFCAQEGGMQRAVMVSLDWKTSTLYRETVLRMPTVMVSKMFQVDRVKVGLKRPLDRTLVAESV